MLDRECAEAVEVNKIIKYHAFPVSFLSSSGDEIAESSSQCDC